MQWVSHDRQAELRLWRGHRWTRVEQNTSHNGRSVAITTSDSMTFFGGPGEHVMAVGLHQPGNLMNGRVVATVTITDTRLFIVQPRNWQIRDDQVIGEPQFDERVSIMIGFTDEATYSVIITDYTTHGYHDSDVCRFRLGEIIPPNMWMEPAKRERFVQRRVAEAAKRRTDREQRTAIARPSHANLEQCATNPPVEQRTAIAGPSHANLRQRAPNPPIEMAQRDVDSTVTKAMESLDVNPATLVNQPIDGGENEPIEPSVEVEAMVELNTNPNDPLIGGAPTETGLIEPHTEQTDTAAVETELATRGMMPVRTEQQHEQWDWRNDVLQHSDTSQEDFIEDPAEHRQMMNEQRQSGPGTVIHFHRRCLCANGERADDEATQSSTQSNTRSAKDSNETTK